MTPIIILVLTILVKLVTAVISLLVIAVVFLVRAMVFWVVRVVKLLTPIIKKNSGYFAIISFVGFIALIATVIVFIKCGTQNLSLYGFIISITGIVIGIINKVYKTK